MTGRILKLSFSLLPALIFVSILSFGFYVRHYLYQQPLQVQPPGYVLMISPGMSVQRIANQLAQDGVLKHPDWFVWWTQVSGARLKLKAGEYLIKPGMTPQAVIDLIISGKVIQHALTIVEGWNFDRLMAAIKDAPKLSHTLTGLSHQDIMAKLGHPLEHPEGRFFPDTYYFPAGTTDIAFLQRAYKILETKLATAWEGRDQQSDLSIQTPYEALILASIIEKESALPEEYEEISGVYHRRLKRKMPLQADPTVIYGVAADYTGQLTGEQLKRQTPYNTYLNPGLPPTPIAMPGAKAILAATNPKPGDTLYFVAKGEGKGHVFSKTLAEHLVAVALYRKKLGNSVKGNSVNVEAPANPVTSVNSTVPANSAVPVNSTAN